MSNLLNKGGNMRRSSNRSRRSSGNRRIIGVAWKDRSKNSRKEKVVKNFISKVQRKEEEREEMEKMKPLKNF